MGEFPRPFALCPPPNWGRRWPGRTTVTPKPSAEAWTRREPGTRQGLSIRNKWRIDQIPCFIPQNTSKHFPPHHGSGSEKHWLVGTSIFAWSVLQSAPWGAIPSTSPGFRECISNTPGDWHIHRSLGVVFQGGPCRASPKTLVGMGICSVGSADA